MRFGNCIALTLAATLVLPAQQAEPAKQLVQQSPSGSLKVVVIEGEGAKNNVRTRSATAPVVEIRDEQDKPISGAEVVFQLPAGGPGGTFNGWLNNQTVRSDEKGRAASTGFQPNEEEGRFNIKVTALSGTKSGSVIIAQSNVSNGEKGGRGGSSISANRSWLKWVAILGGVGVAGGVAAAVKGNGTSTTTAPVPVTITAAPVTVGGPR